jgi:hypothetical protein
VSLESLASKTLTFFGETFAGGLGLLEAFLFFATSTFVSFLVTFLVTFLVSFF